MLEPIGILLEPDPGTPWGLAPAASSACANHKIVSVSRVTIPGTCKFILVWYYKLRYIRDTRVDILGYMSSHESCDRHNEIKNHFGLEFNSCLGSCPTLWSCWCLIIFFILCPTWYVLFCICQLTGMSFAIGMLTLPTPSIVLDIWGLGLDVGMGMVELLLVEGP